MKRFVVLLALCTFVASCAKPTATVLLFMRDGSGNLEYMLQNEVGVMKNMLKKSGIKVVVATLDGSSFSGGSARVQTDLKLTDVKVEDYAGFILPCMAAGALDNISAESVALVKKAVSSGKPVAAQFGSVTALAAAGVLKGKKYAHLADMKTAQYEGAIYSGTGVVRDGLVITSGICPNVARGLKLSNQTEELTLAFIEAIKGKGKNN